MDLRRCEREIQSLGGCLAWSTSVGVGVSFEGVVVHDQDLHALRETLPQVVWLDLSDSRISDVGLTYLHIAKRLEHLSINGTQVTATGLITLRCLANLVQIDVGDTAVTSADRLSLQQAGWQAEINVYRRGCCCGWIPEVDVELMARISQ